MRNKRRVLLLVLVGIFVLAAAPSALGDETTYQLVVPPTNGVNCAGFPHMTTNGTVTGCTPDTAAFPWSFFYSVAADGSVAFQTEGGSIWLAKPDGSSVLLDDSTSDFSPSISYDGSKIVFGRYVPTGDPSTTSSDIYSVNSDGSDLQQVVSGQGINYLTDPVISPDGSSIAYYCGPSANGDTNASGCGPLTDGSYRYGGVMRVNFDGSDPRMIVIGGGANLEPVGPTSLSWSPDSQWIAMDGLLQTADTERELFEYHTDGSDLFNNLDPTRQITHSSFPNIPIYAQFSPDGSQLLYMDFVDGSGNQGNFSYLIGVDGSDPHQIYLNPNVNCSNGFCYGGSYGRFIPTATPVAPPPLVDMTHITVPSVQDLSVAAATSTLTSVNLTVGTVSNGYSASVPAGAIVSQSPSAGAIAHRTVKVGPPVNLVVSSGAPPPETLTVAKTGTGSGKVTSTPSGISCGSTCTHQFANGTSVTLAAAAASGSVFAGWSGSCTGTGSCTVTMSQARSVTATFALLETLSVSKSGSGSGTVSSSPTGISCGSACSHAFSYGTSVTLTASAASGFVFTGWSGACTGTGTTCHVTMTTARAATATFAVAKLLTVLKAGAGSGKVTSTPAGISCGTTCKHAFATGTVVKLTASAKSGSKFTGWSGACSGTGSCVVTMSAAKTVKATFAHTTAAHRRASRS